MDFASVKIKKKENWDKYLDLTRELRKLWISIIIGVLNLQRLKKGTGTVRNQRTNQSRPDYCIVEIA